MNFRLALVFLFLNFAVLTNATAAGRAQRLNEVIDTRSDEEIKAVAQEEYLMGLWKGVDHASESIYGELKITRTHISWQSCETQYSIVMTLVGDTYPDKHVDFVKTNNKRYVTLRLKLEPKQCLLSEQAYLQFSFATNTPRFAKVIEYDEKLNPLGWISFGKP
jgi:hypothetical protein